jgi:ABC-type lipoprotein release transport system permease subunit
MPVSVIPATVAAICAFSFLLSMASAVVPALKAAALDPLRGLRG